MSARADYYFGELEGHPVGSTYADRKEAMYAGLHDNWVPGISGQPDQGADCIALNRGYVDDEDHGDWILYTGAGGNDSSTKRQVADQDIHHHHNAALVYSEENGLPVRVLRGPKGEKPFAPRSGYRYDGLYKVVRHWSEQRGDGFRIWRFHLVRLTPDEARPWTPKDQKPAVGTIGDAAAVRIDPGNDLTVEYDRTTMSAEPTAPEGTSEPVRALGIVQRIVRSTKVSQFVKELHDHACQVCGIQLALSVGQYSEGAHIRGLGAPHDGPDTVDNILCLCPNHHVLFDKGGLWIDDELRVHDHAGDFVARLRTDLRHDINLAHIRYHRAHCGITG